MSLVRLTRRVTFSSGHRYWRSGLSAEENHVLFGPWASPFNHGHNYVLDVTTEGTTNPAHGMVVNIKLIDDLIKQHVIQKFDQKSINDEVPEFAATAPSVENLLKYFANVIRPILPAEATLVALRLEETPLLYGEWHAKENLLTLTRTYEFAASHRLDVPDMSREVNLELFGKCNNPHGHGHNYVLEVTVTGQLNPETGMMVDLGSLDEAINREVVDRYDHRNLSVDIPEFEGKNTTSEVVAAEIFNRLQNSIPAELVRVRLWETARNMFEVNAQSNG